MQQIKCAKCGTEIQEGGRFCPKCGSPVEAAPSSAAPLNPAPSSAAPLNTVPSSAAPLNTPPSNADAAPAFAGSMPAAQTVAGGEVQQQAPVLTESKKKGKKLTAGSVILSIFISLLLIVLGTGTSVLFIIRLGLGKTAIESAVNKVDFAEMQTSALSGSRDKNETLPELIYDNISSNFRSHMPDRKEAIKAIEDFLEEDFIQEFVAAKTSDYVTDMLQGTGDGKIEVEEIMDLLEDHRRDLNKLIQTDYKLTDRDFEDIAYHLTRNVDLDDYAVSELREENSVLDMIKWIGSILVLGLLLGVCVLLIVVLFLVNRRFRRTMVYLGVSFVLIGILDCVAGVMLGMLSGMLNDIVRLGQEFFNTLFAPTRMWSFIVGGSLIFVGLLAAILPQVFRKKKVAA